MRSRLAPSFLECLRTLPPDIRTAAGKAYQLWRRDPTHRSLHFKKIAGSENTWSASVGMGWRALGTMDGDEIIWHWIGSHADYDKKLSLRAGN